MKTKFRSLRFTLASAFIAVGVAVLLTFSGVGVLVNFQNQKKAVTRKQQLAARHAADEIKHFFHDKLNILTAASKIGDLAALPPQKREAALYKLLVIEPAFRRAIVYDDKKRILSEVSKGVSSYDCDNLWEDEIFFGAKAGRKYWGGVHIDEKTAEPTAALAVAVTDIVGDFKGVIAVEVNLKFMWDLMEHVKIGERSLVYVVDRHGRLLACRDFSRVLRGENLKHLTEVGEFMSGEDKTVGEISKGIMGTYVMSSSLALDSPDWAVVIEMPFAEAYGVVIYQIKVTAVALIITMLAAFAIGIYFSRKITEPIMKLNDAAKKIGAGDLNAEIEIVSNNEIGNLSAVFNQMAKDLRETTVSVSELQKEQKRFEDVASNSLDWLWEIDTEGRYVYSSPVVEKMLGYKREEIIGKYFYDIFPDDEREELKKAAFEFLEKREVCRNFLNSVVDKQGRVVLLETNGCPVFSDDGKFIGYRGIDRDVTERERAAEERRKLEQTLAQSEKMSAVGQLAGGVAHEINNPLGVILGFAQSVARQIKEGDPFYMPFRSIEREALRCRKLVTDLLAFSRKPKENAAEKTDINALIDETLTLIEAQTKVKNIEIVREYGEGLPPANIVKNQIQQVIVNLCNNAIDAMPAGGRILIKTGADEASGGAIEIKVADTGHGMAEGVRKRVFEPFFTTKEVGKGTGLGLSLCYEMVKKNGGTIKVESESGKGAVFTVILPSADWVI